MARVEKNTYKVISGTEAAGACRLWQIPAVAADGSRTAQPDCGDGVLLTAGRIEEIQRQARDEAAALGRQEGIEQGRALVRERVENLQSIIGLLEAPLKELDEQLVQEVAELAIVIARHLVRREIRSDPGQIVGVIQQAAGVLPVAARRVRLFLNPDDAATVREMMPATSELEGGWEIIEDPAVSCGGCRLETDSTRIDATLEKRLSAIAAELLGGDRDMDRDDGGS